MSLDEYKDALESQYQGEVTGEASICRMLEVFDSPRQRYVLGSMLQLETETKARLRPAVARLGISLIESETARETGGALANMTEGTDWQSFMASMEKPLADFVARYREIAEMAPPEFKELAESMVVHEQLLLDLVRSEASGISDGSMDALAAQLVFPLSPPEVSG